MFAISSGFPEREGIKERIASRLERLEAVVGVLAVDRLPVDVADAVVAVVEVRAGGGVEVGAEPVLARRGVVPVDRIGGDEVGTGLAGGGARPGGRR